MYEVEWFPSSWQLWAGSDKACLQLMLVCTHFLFFLYEADKPVPSQKTEMGHPCSKVAALCISSAHYFTKLGKLCPASSMATLLCFSPLLLFSSLKTDCIHFLYGTLWVLITMCYFFPHVVCDVDVSQATSVHLTKHVVAAAFGIYLEHGRFIQYHINQRRTSIHSSVKFMLSSDAVRSQWYKCTSSYYPGCASSLSKTLF